MKNVDDLDNLDLGKSKKKHKNNKSITTHSDQVYSDDDEKTIKEANEKYEAFMTNYHQTLQDGQDSLKNLANSNVRTEAKSHFTQTKRAVKIAKTDILNDGNNTSMLHKTLSKDLVNTKNTLIKTRKKEGGMWNSIASSCTAENIKHAIDTTIDIVDTLIPYATAAADLALTMGANKGEVETATDIMKKLNGFTGAQQALRQNKI